MNCTKHIFVLTTVANTAYSTLKRPVIPPVSKSSIFSPSYTIEIDDRFASLTFSTVHPFREAIKYAR